VHAKRTVACACLTPSLLHCATPTQDNCAKYEELQKELVEQVREWVRAEQVKRCKRVQGKSV